MKSKVTAAAGTLALIAVSAPAAVQVNMPGMTRPMPSKHAAKKKPAAKKAARIGAAKKVKRSSVHGSKVNAAQAGDAHATASHTPTARTTVPTGQDKMQMPPQSTPTPPAPMTMDQGQMQRETSSMPMPSQMPGAPSANGAMVRLNQFMVHSHTSGPRGQSRLTGPGMWMLMYDKDLSSRDHLSFDMMGTPEHLTVGDRGTPQLLQTENVDAMHPHDYIMALELRDSLTLDAAKNERLTFLFAPRGEAAIGPVPFMHRESAEGNPDAPLGHALQDGFHDVSTVLGVEYQIARNSFEATAFSGKDIVWPLPLHSSDSYAVRVNQKIDRHLRIGASYADALLPRDFGGAEHSQFVAAWLTASYPVGMVTLNSSLVWGQGRPAHGAARNSFLEEAVYQHGRDRFYNR
ncbi:MAG TPA: hypothetical protein VLM36_03640, partial [Sphingomicrobium sp.]|nr:hypothetical protein [Sphingomicrobium sp.]